MEYRYMVLKYLLLFQFWGGLKVTETIVVQWIVMLIIIGLVIFLTWNLKKKNITKRQVLAEMIVKSFNKMVRQNMGKNSMIFAPYIAALFIFILLSALIGMTGLRSAMADANVTMAFAIVTFVLITYEKFKHKGFFGYFKSFGQPYVILTPINIISEFSTPVSLGFRLFGNMAAGMIISTMVYGGLNSLSEMIGINISDISRLVYQHCCHFILIYLVE